MALYRVTISGLVNSNTFNNVLHLAFDAVDPTPEQTVTNIIDAQWIERVKKFQSNQVQYLNINARNVSSPGPAAFNKTINKLGTGGPAASGDNPVMAAVLKFQTAVAGRTGRGRVHLGGIRLTTSANLGILTAATLASWQPDIDAIAAALLQGGSEGVALSIANRTDPSGSTKSITAIVIRPVLGTMRSRNWGAGA